MKQMSAWDLTCRPVTPEAHSSSRSRSIQAGAAPPLQPHDGLRHHIRTPVTTVPTDPAHQYQLAMGAPFVAAQPASASLWGNLSSKQLQALLVTTTRAATLNNSNYSIDLVSPLEWLQGPRKLDLTRSPSMINFESTNIGGKLYPLTISAKFDPSSNHQSNPQVHHHNRGNHHQQTSSLSSASPLSSTGSSRSNSTESINLSLTKGYLTKGDNTNTILTQGSHHQARPFLAPSSGNSSDADYLAGGDTRVDRRARKKDQNRRAAYNYRRKKMEERDRMIEEEARLVHKHVRLAGKIARIEKKISLILNTKTTKIFDEDGHILCYTCPVCSEHTCENIQTLRNHLKAHFQHDRLQGPGVDALHDCYVASSRLNATKTGISRVGEISGRDDDDGCDSCTDSDETNNRSYVDLYNDCDAKFVIDANLSGDDDNNIIKDNQSF